MKKTNTNTIITQAAPGSYIASDFSVKQGEKQKRIDAIRNRISDFVLIWWIFPELDSLLWNTIRHYCPNNVSRTPEKELQIKQLRFFGQQEKIWAKLLFKDVFMFIIIIINIIILKR